jgi:hypothetical protein
MPWQSTKLTGSRGTWNPDGSTTTYQWQACTTDLSSCQSIAGATSNIFTVTAAELGTRIRLAVTVSDGISSTAYSVPTDVITLPPVPTPQATPLPIGYNGSGRAGTFGDPSVPPGIQQGLLSVPALPTSQTWVNAFTPNPLYVTSFSFTVRWQLCNDTAGNGCVDVSTSTSLNLQFGWENKWVRLLVTPSNAGGTGAEVAGPWRQVLPPQGLAVQVNPPNLILSPTLNSAFSWYHAPTKVTRIWQRCTVASPTDAQCATISTTPTTLPYPPSYTPPFISNAPSYTWGSADRGFYLRIKETAERDIDANGTPEYTLSAYTGTVFIPTL